ncbi:MAG: transglutaminase family protein [Microthrixaceae bacterium]
MRCLEAFRQEVSNGSQARLDRLTIALAGVADPRVDLDAELARLDRLAARFGAEGGRNGDDLIRWMARHGFRGNAREYYHPDNSMLPRVLRTGLGIPITLSIVAIEIGRRHGLGLTGIGVPGEFIVGESLVCEPPAPNPPPAGRRRPHGAAAARFHNPYRSRSFDLDGLHRFWRETNQEGLVTAPEVLWPVGPVDIVERILNNLEQIYLRRSAPRGLELVYRLRVELPSATVATRRRYAEILERSGNFAEGIRQIRVVMDERHPSENVLTTRRDWLLLRRLQANLN